MNKKTSRLRRARKIRFKLADATKPRLCVHRTPRNIYAQIILGGEVLAAASTLHTALKKSLSGDKKNHAKLVGEMIATAAKGKGITKVAFDRSGFKYHGRIKALADSARENGLEF